MKTKQVATKPKRKAAINEVVESAKDKEYLGTVDEGMRNLMRFLWSTNGRRPPASVAEYDERAYEYLEASIACGCVPGKPGLALSLGYANGSAMEETLGAEEAAGNALALEHKRTLDLIHQLTQELTVRGRIGALFLLKSSWGHSDQIKPTAQFLPSINISLSIGANNPAQSSVTIDLPNAYTQLEPIKQE